MLISVPITVFDILGFKLNKNNNNDKKKNHRNELFAICMYLPCGPILGRHIILTLVIIQSGLSLKANM